MKKSRLRDNLLFIFKMVPEARLELARLERRGILNPLCTSFKFENYLLSFENYLFRPIPCT